MTASVVVVVVVMVVMDDSLSILQKAAVVADVVPLVSDVGLVAAADVLLHR